MSTISESSVPKLRFGGFDSVYQQLYTTLTITLMIEPVLALQIMALWIWMERSGFIDTVEKIHNLPLDLISGLADEAVLCINYFKRTLFPTPLELSNSIPLLHFLANKEIPLMFLPDNRSSALDGMDKVYDDIYLKDLGILCDEANKIQETVKQKLVHQEMAEITRSFNAKVSLDDTTPCGYLSSRSSKLAGSGHIGFGFGSSSLFKRGSSSAEPGTFNVGLSKSQHLGPGHLSSPSHNAANFGTDPVKVVQPGSPVYPYGYVGMGRSMASNRELVVSNFSNSVGDAPIRGPSCPKPKVGVIGQPRLGRSTSFHYEPIPRMARGPNSSNGHLILSPPMRVGSPVMIPQVYQQQFPIPDTFVPAEQRTLFVTFSKGYRVHEPELRKYITIIYGDCIESMYMQETMNGEQPLYARIVFYHAETIDQILNGNEKFKFSIHGKHVWVRRYEPKNRKSNPSF